VLGKSEIAHLERVIDRSQVAGCDTLISNEGATHVPLHHRPPLVGAAAIGRALRVSGRTVRRLKKRGLLPGVYQLTGHGRNTPFRIDRPGPLAELRHFLAGWEATR
jgi:hypothetical protein